jgi:MFS family permease
VGRTRRFWKFFLLTVILINIKMIFRHLDATLPKWLLRTYGPTTPFGLLYAINPAIIIVAVPFVMALTQGFDPLKQIKIGTLVAAISPFWITLFPNYFGAVMFSVTLSIGESIYSPKTYEYAMMVSPKGREGTYSALASAPLFTAKFFVGGLSGVLLGEYCTGIPAWPDPKSCEYGGTVWLIIGLVCATSPIGLFLCESCIRQPYINDETGEEELLGGGSDSVPAAPKGARGYAQVSRESTAAGEDDASPQGEEKSSLMRGRGKPPPLE